MLNKITFSLDSLTQSYGRKTPLFPKRCDVMSRQMFALKITHTFDSEQCSRWYLLSSSYDNCWRLMLIYLTQKKDHQRKSSVDILWEVPWFYTFPYNLLPLSVKVRGLITRDLWRGSVWPLWFCFLFVASCLKSAPNSCLKWILQCVTLHCWSIAWK